MGRSLSTDSVMYTWTSVVEVLADLDLYLDTTSSYDNDNHDHQYLMMLAKSVRASVYCNMTWTIWFFDSSTTDIDDNDAAKQMPIKEDRLKDASEYFIQFSLEAMNADDLSSG